MLANQSEDDSIAGNAVSDSNGNSDTAIADDFFIRNDATLENALTGLGDESRDRNLATTVGLHLQLTKIELEELACNWIINNIVSAYPNEATREWLEITMGEGQDNTKVIEGFNEYQKRLKIRERFRWADYLANLYRGAAIVIVAEDGMDFQEPLRKERIRTIKKLEVLDCHKILPVLTGGVDPLEPEFYDLVLDPVRFEYIKEKGYRIHASRVIRFDGIDIPPDAMLRSQPGGWGLSRAELVFDAFRDYESVHRSVAEMANGFNIFKMGVKGLAEAMKTGGAQSEQMLRTRFRTIQQTMSVLNGIVTDADKETADFVTRNFAGIADVMDRFTNRLVGASDLPYTVIFGRGASGLTAQGAGDAEDSVWVKKVEQHQESNYREKFQYLAELIWMAKDSPTKGKIPDGWGFRFRPLAKRTPKAEMEERQLAAQAYSTYVTMGVLLPEEVRQSQFGGSEYSIEIKLDDELWDKKQQEQMGGFGDFGDFGFGGGEEAAAPAEGEPPAPETQVQPGQPAVQQDSLRMDGLDEKLYKQALSQVRKHFKFDSVVSRSLASRIYRKLHFEKYGNWRAS